MILMKLLFFISSGVFGAGVLVNVLTETPGELTYPVIIGALVTAIVALSRELMKSKNEHREDLKKLHEEYQVKYEKITKDTQERTESQAQKAHDVIMNNTLAVTGMHELLKTMSK